MLDWETDSRPRNNCLHPLLAAASRSSSSWAAWIDGAKQLFCIFLIRGDVVVPEDNSLPVERTVFRRNFGNGPLTQPVLVHHDNRAEIAAVRASPGGK